MKITEDMQKILDIAVKLTSEREYSKLMESIITDAMEIANCDAGTLYILNDDKLEFMILRNNTLNVYQGGNGEPISMIPPVALDERFVAAYSAIHRKTVNIADVYEDNSFDWKGPREYDKMTGYRTKSMLVVPLCENDGDVIGVLQLLNAKNENGELDVFDISCEKIISSIASETAVSMSNMLMIQQLNDLLQSFVSSMTTAIDARTPYNANHTYNVAKYCGIVADYIQKKYAEGGIAFNLSENEKEQLIMGAMLHDVGKLIIPLEIMNKADRLGDRLSIMEMRWKYIDKLLLCKKYENKLSAEEYSKLINELNEAKELIRNSNTAGYLDETTREKINSLEKYSFEDDGNKLEFITSEELHEMNIVKGTLTAEERKVIESHVEYTSKMLSEINFGDRYDKVMYYAGAHHEYLDGSGYPKGLKGDQLELPVRILTAIDIYDSLTSTDRPYKKPMPAEKAVSILEEMVNEGKLDQEIVKIVRACFIS